MNWHTGTHLSRSFSLCLICFSDGTVGLISCQIFNRLAVIKRGQSITDLQRAVQPPVVCCDPLQLLALPVRLKNISARAAPTTQRALTCMLLGLGGKFLVSKFCGDWITCVMRPRMW
jgi:hypothetical protein